MKKDEIQVGKVYAVKVAERVSPVRIDSDRGSRYSIGRFGAGHQGREKHDGWMGTNLNTGRRVRIRSATKCRYLMQEVNHRWIAAQVQPG